MPPKLQRRIDIVESSDAFMPGGLSMAQLLVRIRNKCISKNFGCMAESSILCALVTS